MPVNNFSIMHSILMNILGIGIWWFGYQYFDQVLPKEFGVVRPWYYPFTATYWREVG